MKTLPIKITGLKPSFELQKLVAQEHIVLAVIPNAQGDEFTHILYPTLLSNIDSHPKISLIERVIGMFSDNPAVKIESLSKKETHK